MHDLQPLPKETVLASLPPEWPDHTLRAQIADHAARTGRCVVVLDDDPTGTQTVHGVKVLTRWTAQDIQAALGEPEAALYLLTNTRSMPLEQAQSLNHAIASALVPAARRVGRPIQIVSRSDSTLRGHYPGEVDALSQSLTRQQGQAFDSVCLIPAFPEAGRYTIAGVHWVQEGDMLVPAAETAFARDAVFGYRHSALPEWVAERTSGRIQADQVQVIDLGILRQGGPEAVARSLCGPRKAPVVVVDAVAYRDLEVFVAGLLQAEATGHRYLFRTAAPFVKVLAGLADRPLLSPAEILAGRTLHGGLIIFGSHVPQSSGQLSELLSLEGVDSIELAVTAVLNIATRQSTIRGAATALDQALAAGRDVVLYTSRDVVKGADTQADLAIGRQVSSALTEALMLVEHEPAYLLAKGGITSSDLATEGLGVRSARVQGQVLPGVPVWSLLQSARWPQLPYIVFPGNVGGRGDVAKLVCALRTP